MHEKVINLMKNPTEKQPVYIPPIQIPQIIIPRFTHSESNVLQPSFNKKEQIKNLIKESQKENKEKAKLMIDKLKMNDDTNMVVNSEIKSQGLSFKARLELKKMQRKTSHFDFHLQNKMSSINNADSVNNVNNMVIVYF